MTRQRRPKYNAEQVKKEGNTFASKREFERFRHLQLLQHGGKISCLRCHPRYLLYGIAGELKTPDRNGRMQRLFYRADFRYFDEQKKRWVVEDVKGMDTQVSKLKRLLVEQAYGIKITIVK